MGDDLLLRNWRRHFVRKPIKAHALGDANLIENPLIRHWSPPQRKINRHKRGACVPAIDFLVKHTSIEREMCQWFELVISITDGRIERERLLRLGGNQNAWRIRNRPMQVMPADNGNRDHYNDAKQSHISLTSRFDAAAALYERRFDFFPAVIDRDYNHITIPPSTQMTCPVM